MSLPPQNLLYPIDSWTKDDVQKWFEYCIEEYSLGDINLNDFEMNGKALLLLNEDGFKQRSIRSGDILYRALQQHQALIKSLTCQSYPYSFWPNFQFPRQLSYPPYASAFSPYKYPIPIEPIRTRQISTSSSSSIIACVDKNDTTHGPEPESATQIRYYKDRVDFHGEILMKPKGAKNCRILWEFLYTLLEDPDYQSIIHWENREKMIFRILQADKLAALWGLQKNRISMTYEKLSRGMRYYYANNIIIKEQSKRLLYRFTRSPEEIRRTTKRSSDSTIRINEKKSSTPSYLKIFSISKSDRSCSSSTESDESEKPSKRKQTFPISLADRLSQNCSTTQALNLVVPKQEHFVNYKKQKFLYTREQ